MNMNTLGWRIAAVFFGLSQALALIMLTAILHRQDTQDARISDTDQRVSRIEGRLQSMQMKNELPDSSLQRIER